MPDAITLLERDHQEVDALFVIRLKVDGGDDMVDHAIEEHQQ